MSTRGRGKKAASGAVKHIWTVEKAIKAGESANPRERYFINVKKTGARRVLAGADRVFGPKGSPGDIYLHTIVYPDGTASEVRISGDIESVQKALINDVGLTEEQANAAIANYALDRANFEALFKARSNPEAFAALIADPRLNTIWEFIKEEFPKGGRRVVKSSPAPDGESIDSLVYLGRALRNNSYSTSKRSGSKAATKHKGKGGKTGGKKRSLAQKFADLAENEGLLVSALKDDGTGAHKVAKGVKKQGYISIMVNGRPLYSDNYAALERALDQIDPSLKARLGSELRAAQEAFQARSAPPAAAAAMRTAAARGGSPRSPGGTRRTALTGRVLTAPS